MANVIMVHGMAANENSWFEIPAKLTGEGHSVSAIRLAGHGGSLLDKTSNTVTMDDYIKSVSDAFPKSGKCILIGHSMGGMIISQVAAKYSGRVEKLVYVTAMLPKEGETIQKIIDRTGTDPLDIIAEYTKHLPDALFALSRQPKGPLNTPFPKSTGFESIPRYFIKCNDDGIIPPNIQDEMIADGAPIEVIELDSDHLPQRTVTGKLVDALNKTINK